MVAELSLSCRLQTSMFFFLMLCYWNEWLKLNFSTDMSHFSFSFLYIPKNSNSEFFQNIWFLYFKSHARFNFKFPYNNAFSCSLYLIMKLPLSSQFIFVWINRPAFVYIKVHFFMKWFFFYWCFTLWKLFVICFLCE